MLLEKSTGIYTGSVYTDGEIIKAGLLGEKTLPKDGETLFQKTHNLMKEEFSNPEGILFLIRNPFQAVVAEWKRRNSNGHTADVEEELFRGEEWERTGTIFLRQWKDLAVDVVKKHLVKGCRL